MKKIVAIGLIIIIVATFSLIAIYKSQNLKVNNLKNFNLDNLSKNASELKGSKNFDLNDLKFVDSKIIDYDGSEFISTKLQNDSNTNIVEVKYTYNIDGQPIILELSQQLSKGETSELITVKVKDDVDLKKIELLKVDVSFVDSGNQINNLEFIKST